MFVINKVNVYLNYTSVRTLKRKCLCCGVLNMDYSDLRLLKEQIFSEIVTG